MNESESLEKKIVLEATLCLNYGWKQHPKYQYNTQCEICMDSMKGKYVLETKCGHCFDYDCMMFTLVDYKTYKCPLCNTSYKKN